jgi:glycosyltransferase involved in cell wall biosynthesis
MTNVQMASIIIIVKNDRGVEQTLDALMLQVAPVKKEVIVIDASKRSVLADIKKKYPSVRWHYYEQHGKKFTIPEQRNRGVELSTGDVVIFIDANCLPNETWLSAIVSSIQSGEDVVCGPCRPSNPTNLVQYIEEHDAKTYVSECTTINVAVRRSVLKKVGLFDTALAYGEDVDYFWRVKDAGYKICFDPAVAISHDYGKSKEQFRRAYRYGKSRAILHKKHWRTRILQLVAHEPHVWIYPLFLLTLPLAIWFPAYLLVLLIPLIKNRSLGVIVHHLIFAVGVLVGLFVSF